jgi:serine/threonine protein phosphatase PrpC
MKKDEATMPAWSTSLPPRGPLDPPPPQPDVDVEFAARSRRGARNAGPDHHYLVLRLGRSQETLMTNLPEGDVRKRFDECGYGMVVADGVGDTGESASRIAVATLAQLGIQFGRWNLRIDEPIADEVMDRGERFYRAIDSTLLQATHGLPDELQTTLTAVYTAGSELFFAHVGNSRAYLFRDGELMQLTRDGVSEEPRLGKSGSVETSSIPRRPVTDTLGHRGSSGPRIDIERCGLLDGDLVLLCTSGLTSAANDAAIAKALRSFATPDEQSRALMELVDRAGGTEDATVLVAHYSIHN